MAGQPAPRPTDLRLLAFLANGLTIKAAATRLRLSDQAARRRAMLLRRYFGARSNAHAVFLAVQRGMLLAGQSGKASPPDPMRGRPSGG